ncbi:tRNA1(Val) (adenine(37)-N6)-methyltransferase [Shewanella psychrotolerans]|uniref:tRNA1(Val) (adenine(37)-N6)-methyltransferase n=1 Tax=Shewanella psychrotolerans TaxID=2864206 RepID=UPI001C660CE8|nr:methyltransferase [Shewanella psychrotolerans]QYK00797.1 methyltransferase [Shewanella psychrotolerans]
MPFSFKQFHIDDSHCGMPVSTDGVLLGAWAPLSDAESILDIGAGSGLLSLMAAQRSEAQVTAIEIDSQATQDCQHNINQSPWHERITLVTQCVTQWAQTHNQQYDHILCNPPYFDNGPQSNDQRRAQARHTDTLNFEMLLTAIKRLLNPDGNASLILPQASLGRFLLRLGDHQLNLIERVDIISVEGKSPQRHLLLLAHKTPQARPTEVKQLIIRNRLGDYTQEMVELTRAFYLKM